MPQDRSGFHVHIKEFEFLRAGVKSTKKGTLENCREDRAFTYCFSDSQTEEMLTDVLRRRFTDFYTLNSIDPSFYCIGVLQIPKSYIEYVTKGFHYSALETWNNIPINIRELPTLNRVKNQLKSYAKS